jgi:hypothetical protein
MSARTVAESLSVDEALGYIRDVLGQSDAHAVLAALLPPYLICGSLVAFSSHRFARTAINAGIHHAGHVVREGARWRWYVDDEVYADLPDGHPLHRLLRTDTYADTLDEADRALCAQLRSLGWLCLEAP